MKKYSVAIVDDHTLIAKALSVMIEGMKDFEVLFEAGNGLQLMDKMVNKKNIPDIILLDISMPQMDGFATAKWITENHPAVLVMALTMEDDEEKILKMIRNGARGYLLKSIQPHELEAALLQLAKEGFYYAGNVIRALTGNVMNINKKISEFSPRENELLQLLCTDLSYKEIADKMFLSVRTVEGYAGALMEKLEVKTRVGLVLLAVKKGFV